MIDDDNPLYGLNGPGKCSFVFVPTREAKNAPMHAAATAGCFDFGDREHWLCNAHDVRIDRPSQNTPYWKDCAELRALARAEDARRAEEQRKCEAKAKKASRWLARTHKRVDRYVGGVLRALKGDAW